MFKELEQYPLAVGSIGSDWEVNLILLDGKVNKRSKAEQHESIFNVKLTTILGFNLTVGYSRADIGTKPLEPRRMGELRAKLPLRLPRGSGWLGAVAAARQLALAAAEATREVALRGDEVPGTWQAVAVTWVGRIIITILVGVFTLVWCKCRSRPSTASARGPTRDQSVQTEPVAQRTVASQAPTTYTSVRGCLNPRFHPLPEASHG